jgi:hypothetical protein
MKITIAFFLTMTITASCKTMTKDDVMNSAAVHISGIFIKKYINTGNSLRIKGSTVIKKGKDNVFHVSGSVEGFSTFNYPVSINHFTEALLYLGGDTAAYENWVCIEIYIGSKKLK